MESALYREIFADGEAKGRTEAHASTLARLLIHRLGALDPDLRRRIRAYGDADTLEAWTEEVFLAADVDAVRRLVDKISKALPS